MKGFDSFKGSLVQLQTLNSQAKLLIGSLVVILVMGLFLVAQYAGTSDLVPLPISLTNADVRAQTINYLKTTGVKYKDTGAELMVNAEQLTPVVGQLLYGQPNLISADQIDFASLIGQESPFISREQNRQRWLVATQTVLGRMITQMQGVRSAEVIIAPPDRTPGIGSASVKPSATVNLVTDGGEMSQQMVDAVASAVAQAYPRLTVENVAIIDATSARSYRARAGSDLTSSVYLGVKRAHEKYHRQTIEEHLSYIRGVRVAVNAQVDTTTIESRKESFEDPKVGPLRETTRNTTSTNQRSSGQPGVQPNTGASIAASAIGSQMSDERADSRTMPKFPRDISHVTDQRGYARKINASIGVPRSYFVASFRIVNNDATATPDDAALQPIVVSETAKIQGDVELLIDTSAFDGAAPGSVRVSMVSDSDMYAEAGLGSTIAPGGSGSGLGGGSDGLLKYVSLGGLALISLALMFMMVRKATVKEELPSPDDLVGMPPALTEGESDLVGEADESPPVLEGVEVDEDAIKRQQMLEQVSSLVIESPDEAATLVRRWLRD